MYPDLIMKALLALLYCMTFQEPIVRGQSFLRMVPVAAIFRSNYDADIQNAFRQGLYNHHTDNDSRLLFTIDNNEGTINSQNYDSWNIMQSACTAAKKGFLFLTAAADQRDALAAFASLSRKIETPFINLARPFSSIDSRVNEFHFNLNVDLTSVIGDLILFRQWRNITYMYDYNEGMINIGKLTSYLLTKDFGLLVRTIDLSEHSTAPDDLLEFFLNFHEREHETSNNHVILDIDKRNFNVTIKALQAVSLKSRNFHYVIATPHLPNTILDDFRSGIINISAFQIVNEKSKKFVVLKRLWSLASGPGRSTPLNHIPVEAFVAFDAIQVIALTMKQLSHNEARNIFNETFRRGEMWNKGYPGLYCYPTEDKNNPKRPFLPLEHGSLLAKYVRKVDTEDTTTGRIRFDKRGYRRNYKIDVVELLSYGDNVAHNFKTRNEWKHGSGFTSTFRQYEDLNLSKKLNDRSEKERELIITTVKSKPFLMHKKDYEKFSGNDQYEGYCVDLMRLISKNLSQPFRIQLVKDDQYGSVDKKGRWNGMIGELLRDEADMAVAPLTINRQRERVVDFSKPFMTTGISIMVKRPEKQEFSVFSFMQPLSNDVWMYIIFAYVGVSIMIFLVARFSPYEWRVEENANGNLVVSNDFSLYNCLWFTLAAFMQQGTDILPRSISGRVASSAWWFFTMIIVSSYTANLAAFLTLEKMQASIGSVEELAKQTKIKYGIQGVGSTATFFKESSVPIYQRMWAYMSTEKGVLVKNYEEGIQKVRESKGNYAFLIEATANEYYNTRKPCDTLKVGENLNTLGYGVATKFGSRLRVQVNLIVLELLEKGELKKLENKWWYEKGQCEQGMSDSQSASLTLSKVAGIFYLLIGGMILAMIVALGEFVYRLKMDSRKKNKILQPRMQTLLPIPSSYVYEKPVPPVKRIDREKPAEDSSCIKA